MLSSGTFLGTATFPMAALTALSIFSAVYLAALGDAHTVAVGLAVACVFYILAWLAPRPDGQLANGAQRAVDRGQYGVGYAVAGLVSAFVPMLAVLAIGVVLECFSRALVGDNMTVWLWSYGVVTLPLTLRAHLADRADRTLNSIQSYAAQVSFALVAFMMMFFSASPSVVLMVAIIPQALPFTVGFFLALADRNALRDVQM